MKKVTTVFDSFKPVGRIGVAKNFRALDDGQRVTTAVLLTFRDANGARAGQFKLTKEDAEILRDELIKQLTSTQRPTPQGD